MGGASARGGPPGPAELASPPAEPSPKLMTGGGGGGQEIGAGSYGSGDSAARPAGRGRRIGPRGRGCSFDPTRALLGSRCREPRRREGGARGHWAQQAARTPPSKKEKQQAEPLSLCLRGAGWPGRQPGGRAGEQSARPPWAPPLPLPGPRARGRPLASDVWKVDPLMRSPGCDCCYCLPRGAGAGEGGRRESLPPPSSAEGPGPTPPQAPYGICQAGMAGAWAARLLGAGRKQVLS